MNDGSLIILSGGKNSRMGQNKAFLNVESQTIIENIIDRLGGFFKEIIVVTNNPEAYVHLHNVQAVADIIPRKGPLSGIHAGLINSSFERSLVVACDMPFVSGKLASYLFKHSKGYDVTVPMTDGKYQPLFAVYSKKCIKTIENQLSSGRFKITAFYEWVKVKEIDESLLQEAVSQDDFHVTEKVFFNVNTPKELEEAKEMAQHFKNEAKKYVEAHRWKAGEVSIIDDELVIESPLTINLNEKEVVTLLCTPQDLEELAVGFLCSEGLLTGKSDDVKVRIDKEQGMAWVSSYKTSMIAEQTFLKRYITTGCGKGTTFYNVMDAKCNPVETKLTLDGEKLLELMGEVQKASQLFKDTGGVHLTALCSTEKMVLYREDIGRHNALDKIVGKCFLDNISIEDKVLFTTGRLSSEILLKVAKLGIPILVSRSAPTSLAVNHARKLGITLVGFARNRRFNVYANEERVLGGSK